MNYAYITLLSTESYLPGVLALNRSLALVSAKYPLVVLASNGLSENAVGILEQQGLETIRLEVSLVGCNKRECINQEAGYSHWSNTFDKLAIWRMTQFDKLVFLDSDMMVMKNIDHLFMLPHMSAVISDKYDEPDGKELNSGLIVVEPSVKDYLGLCSLLESGRIKKENMGDQDVIRAYYNDWQNWEDCHLPDGYNLFYSNYRMFVYANSAPIQSCGRFRGKRKDVYIIHFIGIKKPWMFSVRAIYRRIKQYGGTMIMLKYQWLLLLAKMDIKSFEKKTRGK